MSETNPFAPPDPPKVIPAPEPSPAPAADPKPKPTKGPPIVLPS